MTPFKRRVFYLGGFDPRGARHYHALYIQAAERLAAIGGDAIAVSPRRRTVPHFAEWDVAGPDGSAETRYTFLEWDDLVRRAWTRNPLRLLRDAARLYRDQWRHLDRPLARRLPRGPVIAFLYPLALLTLLPPAIALAALAPALALLPWRWAIPVALGVGVSVSLPILRRARVAWMLRFLAFNDRAAGGEGDPDLSARLDLFVDAVDQALDGEDDETLLVTHSNGSILAVPLMARLLARRGGAMPANFTLVTLGQCIPLILARTDRPAFRDRLAQLARGHFQWVDIGSPPDGAAFHAVDPARLIGLDTRYQLDQLSPRFHLFRDAANRRRGWSSKYEGHFDYLRVGDRPSPLDLPALTGLGRPVDAAVDAFRHIP